jgi:predicted transcriptional regulator
MAEIMNKRGRPKKAAADLIVTVPVYVRLTADTKRRLEQVAEARQVSVSEVCREYIMAGMNRQGVKHE